MAATAKDLEPYEPWRVSYRSDERELSGFWLPPAGEPPYPAVVFNHGSIGLIPANLAGVHALRDMGYAVLAAVRRGHNGEPGTYWLDRVTAEWGSAEMGDQLVEALRDELRDARAAVEWVAGREDVDANRLATVGSSFGAVLTVLAAGQDSRLRAAVSFAGPSQSWSQAPALRDAMLSAAGTNVVPLFLAQARNDHDLAPTYAVGGELARHGHPHETRIYPDVGATPIQGHGIFGGAVHLWRDDVRRFLASWMSGHDPADPRI